MKPLDLFRLPLQGPQLIEASAGTGKTWTITVLYARLLLQGTPVESLLVVTFTRAATAELRDRLRQRLAELLTVFEHYEALMRLSDTLVSDADLSDFDPVYRAFVVEYQDNLATAKQRLSVALAAFDQAAIYTIHSFCQRVLTESAFEAGHDFNQALLTSTDDLLKQVATDFWREQANQAHPIWAAYLLKKKESPSTWAERVKPHLGKPYLHQPNWAEIESSVEAPIAQLNNCRRKLEKLLVEEGEAALAALLSHPKLNGRTHNKKYLADWFDQLRMMTFSDGLPNSCKALDRLTDSAIKNAMNKGGIAPSFLLFDAIEAFSNSLQTLNTALESRWVALNHRLAVELETRLSACHREAGTLAFDDLLTLLQSALCDYQRGPALIEAVCARYQAALIDEFQDTDPIQWNIFSRLFLKNQSQSDLIHPTEATCLILVGDPKQAIYSFRGGDLQTYLSARQQVQGCYSLHRNFRSIPELVSGINILFGTQPHPFIQEITYFPVEGVGHLRLCIENETSTAPIRFQFLPSPEDQTPHTKTSAGRYAATFVAAEIARLLDGSKAARICLMNEKTGLSRPLTPGDIAILVPGRREARQLEVTLAALNIPVVRQNRESVFSSIEAEDLYIILYAIAHPNNQSAIHAALASIAMGYSGTCLSMLRNPGAAISSQSNRSIYDYFQDWHDRWQRHSFIAMFRDWLDHIGPDGCSVAGRLLAIEGGERRLTNLLHLAELIQLESRLTPGITPLLYWYRQQLKEPDEHNEAMLQRLPSDAQRVNIVTIHASKGLEYPVVFCPYLWDGKLLHKRDIAARCHDDDGRVWLDFGSSRYLERRQQQKIEALAEKRRLLYVALTRAQSRLYLYWGWVNPPRTDQDAQGLHTAALAGLLHGEDISYLMRCTQRNLEADLQALCQRAPMSFALDILATFPPFLPTEFQDNRKNSISTSGGPYLGIAEERNQTNQAAQTFTGDELIQPDCNYEKPVSSTPVLAAAFFSRALRSDWHITSFTSLARPQYKVDATLEMEPFSEEPVDYDQYVEIPATSAQRFLRPPINRGNTVAQCASDLNQFTFPAGEVTAQVAGICLHAIFEDWARGRALAHSVSDRLARYGISDTWQPVVMHMTKTALTTPLHNEAHSTTPAHPSGYQQKRQSLLRLEEIPYSARHAEFEFMISTGSIDLAPLADILARHDQPTLFIEAARGLKVQDIAGLMRGFIDLIFCFEGRYFLLDWKSNWLGSSFSDYTPAKLEVAMAAHHYDLQALIYTLALDRYLSVRIPDYEYDRHVGGAYYLFLRGMGLNHNLIGKCTKTGVWFKRFEPALLRDIASTCGFVSVCPTI